MITRLRRASPGRLVSEAELAPFSKGAIFLVQVNSWGVESSAFDQCRRDHSGRLRDVSISLWNTL